MRHPTLCLLILFGGLADAAQAMMCFGPDLHHLRVVNANTVEISGRGGTARTSDGGETWIPVPAVPAPLKEPVESDNAHPFTDRIFRAPDGTQLRNRSVNGSRDVEILRPPARQAWTTVAKGLLLGVGDGAAYVFQGDMSIKDGRRGVSLSKGMIREVSFGKRVLDKHEHAPPFQIEVTPESFCLSYRRQDNHALWDKSPCDSPDHRVAGNDREINGFAVAPAAPGAKQDERSRDVYLSGADFIMRWNGATRTWQHLQTPPGPGWFECNGPVPRPER